MSSIPIELFISYWFPLGVNNILLLGKKINEIKIQMDTKKPKYYRGSEPPYRVGDEILWKSFISVYDESPNFELEVLIKWHGSGFVICKANFTKRQEGKQIKTLIDVPANVVRKANKVILAYQTDIFLKQLLPHQENYARNVVFGKGLSSALNNYDPESDLFSLKLFHKKLQTLNQNGFLSKASNDEIAYGFNFLSFKLFIFNNSLENLNLSEFDDDFIKINSFKPLSKNTLYIKGKSHLAYDLLTTTDTTKYIEKRGSIALHRSITNDNLVDYLLALNSVLHFCSLLSYEFVKIRESLSKARLVLTMIEDHINILSDFVEVLEAKLPLYLELVSFIDIDASDHIKFLREEANEKLKILEKSDPYIVKYNEKFNSYLNTLKRISESLTKEILALNEYLSIKTQQKYVEISEESKSAATRSLDTQISLAEFQRSTILKSRRTKWISSFAIAGAIASTTGIFSNLALVVWKILVIIKPSLVTLLGGDPSNIIISSTPPTWFNGLVQVSFTILTAILLGKFIIYLESKIPDIVQYVFNLNNLEISKKSYDLFFKSKSVKTIRDSSNSFQIIWLEKNNIVLDLNRDLIYPQRKLEKILFKWKRKIELKIRDNKTVSRQSVCTLNCKYKIQDGKIISVLLNNLTISVERNALETSEAYIYPIHFKASEILLGLLGEYEKEKIIEIIMNITKASEYDQFNRGSLTIEKNIKNLLYQTPNE